MALMGRNGMGKIIDDQGDLPDAETRGRDACALTGATCAPLASHMAAQAGLGLVPEGRRCFGAADGARKPDRRRAPRPVGFCPRL